MPMAAGGQTSYLYMPYDLLLGDNLPFAISLEGDTKKIVNLYEQEDVKKTLNTLRDFYKKDTYILKLQQILIHMR
ncbi:hypothetical protein Q5M85_00135 [Paraclostridium bifermentans]|nr:hypothetical protein [Paraclostridium bifermentans]